MKYSSNGGASYTWVPANIEKIDKEHKSIIPEYDEDEGIVGPKETGFYNVLYRDEDISDRQGNLLEIENSNEGNIVNLLQQRFVAQEFCTYCTGILVYINPYCRYQDDFDENRKLLYLKRFKESYYEMTNMPPHLYSLVMAAVHPLAYSKKKYSRSIVFFGESGSGKSESFRFSLAFITRCFGESGIKKISSHTDKPVVGIYEKVN